MKKRILIITDCTDVAANELRATLVTDLDKMGVSDKVEVEPVVKVAEFSVLNGCFLARLMAESYDPSSLTILAIVNPISPSTKSRARFAGELSNGIRFVGANTGIFTMLENDYGINEIYETSNEGLRGDKFISFGGKYIHAPYAAKCAVSKKLSDLNLKSYPKESVISLAIEQGQVLHIDNFGVSKINLEDDYFERGKVYSVSKNGEKLAEATFCASMKELEDGQLAIYPGSSLGKVEIGKVRELDTAASLGLKIGDVLEFSAV